MPNDFKTDLELGKSAQAYFSQKLLDTGEYFLVPPTKTENRADHSGLHVAKKCADQHGILYGSINVKADTRIASTGNVVFEHWTNGPGGHGKEGWGHSKTTNYIAVVDYEKDL